MRTTRRAPALFALSILLTLAALLSLSGSAAAQSTVDYDEDNDGYIDVGNHAQLNAIRYDLDGNGDATHADYVAAFPNRVTSASGRMGCPSGTCTGYELTADIDLDTDGDGNIGTDTGDAYHNSGAGWNPIGAGETNGFTGDFKGNGFTIDNLFINRAGATAGNGAGLFGFASATSRIESVGLTNVNVRGNDYVGALVGGIRGEVVACWSTGSVTATTGPSGGLVGWTPGSISSSYSHASATGTLHVGGLLGACQSCTVTHSYATGVVTRSGSGADTRIGGLMGSGGTTAATASYYDTTTSGCVSGGSNGCTTSAGGAGAVAKTTHQLQAPVTYAGIYSAWNANLDSVAGGDHPWYFGKHTEYPALIYGTTVNYDRDGDGYIDVENLAQLRALWYDLNGDGDPQSSSATAYGNVFPRRDTNAATRMGCPSGTCTGYELTANLEFDTNGDGSVTTAGDYHSSDYYHSTRGWNSIGTASYRYTSNLKGNGYTVNNLFINDQSQIRGLFGGLGGRVESLGVTNANITTGRYAGILVGINHGTIVACYTTGSISDQINNSIMLGGLVGRMVSGSISSSYSHASVSGDGQVGGLVGQRDSGTITNSYSTGAVSGSSNVGGLLGSGSSGVTASYWNTTTSGRSTSAGGSGAVGKTTSQLQSPTGYTGIYADWNANLDGQSGNDDPWSFCRATQYPALKYGGHNVLVQGGCGDYDTDNDNYIEVATHAQLNAIRYDLNGNGARDTTTTTLWANHTSAFVNAASGMGCPATCTGYELTADIDLDTDGDGSIGTDTGDAYYNGGSGWQPISAGASASDRYSGDFKGNGHTINNLFINRSTNNIGLFGSIGATARIETLGVTNADVTGGGFTGILVGEVRGNIVACYTTGAVAGSSYIGGLVGYTAVGATTASIRSSYSTAYVSGATNSGGLIGRLAGGSISHSYATGRVVRASGTGTSFGGFAGASASSVTASYWDTSTSGCVTGSATGCTNGDGANNIAGIVGKTTRELQTVTSYTGIFANWNANLDGQTGNDDPWDFGNGMQYPMLKYDGMSTAPQGGLAMGIPDNWNAPIVGERVGVCLINGPTTAPGLRAPSSSWIWEKSANGDTWGPVGSNSGPTYEYIPTTADVGSYLRARVELTDGSFAYTRILGGRVKSASTAADATQGAAATFVSGATSPRVGVDVTANNPAPSDATDTYYAWQRCPNTASPHTDCVFITANWIEYTPVAADVGNYLRMYVYYATSAGVWTRHESGFTGQVAAASQ